MTQGKTLAVKYASLMVKRFLRTASNENHQQNGQELTDVSTQRFDTVQEVDWDGFQVLLRGAGTRHVLINFYSNHVWTHLFQLINITEQAV